MVLKMAKFCPRFLCLSLVVQFFLLKSISGKPDLTLKAVPENQTLWATNFMGFQAIAEVVADLAQPCILYRSHPTEMGNFTAINSTIAFPEVNITTSVVDNNVTAEITFNVPIASSFELIIICKAIFGTNYHNMTTINVADCSSNFSTDVMVSFNETAEFQGLGDFECNDTNAELFHSSGNLLTTTSTVCQSDATWENQENVQCWKAASVELTGTYQLKAGETIYLRCEYLDDGFPNGTSSTMFVGNQNTKLSKGDNYTRVVTWEDNHKDVYCQAETQFTQHFPESGKSKVETIDIIYAPLVTTSESIVCEWHVNISGLCLLNFLSNPHVDEVYLFINGSTPVLSEAKTNLTSNGDEQIFHFLKEKVAMIDNGSYTLEVKSSAFPSNRLYINFDIFVYKAPEVIPPQTEPSELPYIIGLSVMAAVLVVSAIFNIYLARSKTVHKKKVVGEKKVITIPNRYATATSVQVPDTEEAIYEGTDEHIYNDNVGDQDIYADVI